MVQIEKIQDKYYIHDVNQGIIEHSTVKKTCEALWKMAIPEHKSLLYTNICVGLQIYDERKATYPFYHPAQFVQSQKTKLRDIRGPGNMTPLLFASKQGDMVTVGELLKNFTHQDTVNERDEEGNTALRLACLYDIGRPIVKLLSNYKYTDLNLSNPLYVAVVKKQTESVRILLRAAIRRSTQLNINQLNQPTDRSPGINALMLACWKGYREIINLLLSYRNPAGQFVCDVNIRDNLGNTALHYAARNNQLETVIQLLRMPTINPCLRNHRCLTPVEYALKSKHFQIANIIFNHPKYSAQRKLNIFLFLIGVALFLGVFLTTDSKTSQSVSALSFLPFLMGILFPPICKRGVKRELLESKQLFTGNNSYFGLEVFSSEEKNIISASEVKEDKNSSEGQRRDSISAQQVRAVTNDSPEASEVKEELQGEEPDSLKKDESGKGISEQDEPFPDLNVPETQSLIS